MDGKLFQTLVDCIRDMADDAATQEYNFNGEYYQFLWVYKVTPEDVDAAIEEVRNNPDITVHRSDGTIDKIDDLQVITLGIDDIIKMKKERERQIANIENALIGFGEDNSVYYDFSKLPLVLEHQGVFVHHVAEPDAEAALTQKFGIGILHIRGINRENYRELPRNFEYNLAKSHSLFGYSVSRHWLIICDSLVPLDVSIYGLIFDADFMAEDLR